MTYPRVPEDDRTLGWGNRIAKAVNALLTGSVQKDGTAIYSGDTAGASYDQAKTQALMDAVEALSERLK
jgi:predicted exporter